MILELGRFGSYFEISQISYYLINKKIFIYILMILAIDNFITDIDIWQILNFSHLLINEIRIYKILSLRDLFFS